MIKSLCIFITLTAISITLVTDVMQALLLLALAYLLSAFLFVWVGAEFAAIMLFIIYVGAVVVLFTIVIIALDLRRSQILETERNYLPFGLLLGFIYFILIVYLISPVFVSTPVFYGYTNWGAILFYSENIKLFAETLYNYYFALVGIAALLLLVAMVGAISLIADPERRSVYKVKDFPATNKVFLWRANEINNNQLKHNSSNVKDNKSIVNKDKDELV